MSFVLDTTVLIDVLRGNDDATAFLHGLEAPPVCSEISRIEVLRGVRSQRRQTTHRFLAALEWRTVDHVVARRAGELGRTWRRNHPGIGTADLAIAATAELSGLPLATSNTKHFPMFDGLERPYR